MVKKLKEIRARLQNMLGWSDRLGSDERNEIQQIIQKIDELYE